MLNSVSSKRNGARFLADAEDNKALGLSGRSQFIHNIGPAQGLLKSVKFKELQGKHGISILLLDTNVRSDADLIYNFTSNIP